MGASTQDATSTADQFYCALARHRESGANALVRSRISPLRINVTYEACASTDYGAVSTHYYRY